MSKLIDSIKDDLRKKEPHRVDLLEVWNKQVCFDISDVANYFWSHPQKDWNDWTQGYPTVAPVYDHCWFEGRRPYQSEIKNAEKLNRESVPHRWAVMLLSIDFHGNRIGLLRDAFTSEERIPGDVTRFVIEETEAGDDQCIGWAVSATFWFQLEPHLPIANGKAVCFLVSPSGQIVGKPSIDAEWSKSLTGRDSDEWQEEADLMRPSLFALSLLHCKNVSYAEHRPDEKLQKARARKNKLPLTTYRTLQIEPMKQILKKEGDIEKNGIKKALHICRGHFANYSPERPLFGRVSGKFWIPAHTRGSKDAGEVVKDYAVKRPAKDNCQL